MSEGSSAPDDTDFSALEAYLEALHRRRSPNRDHLMRGHPHLSSLFDCLDVLDHLAPDGDADAEAPATNVAAPAAPGASEGHREFGPYELLEELGRGGMGVVFKARQKSLDRLVAVKMILASNLASDADIRRFQVEARAAAGVQHPHIVRMYEVGQQDGQHFFSMEYVEGASLAAILAKGSLDLDAAARLVATVAGAVQHLHEHGIVHRDLKPSNILVDKQGEPYVTDFGLAKVFEGETQLTASKVIAGTPSYMAPEQAAGRTSAAGPPCDVYSLGAILYELLTGGPPFRADNPLDTLVQVLEREPTAPRRLNRAVPRGLELVCLKCLAKNPADRYASAAALAADLARYLKREPLEVQEPGVLERVGRWARREPALASRLATLAVLYYMELVNYHALAIVDWNFHLQISAILGLWAAASVAFQRLIRVESWTIAVRFAWATADAAMLLAVLLLADGAASPIVVGYPMLIVASALWFRVRLVWFVTALSVASYLVLMWDYYAWRPELQHKVVDTYYRHVDFLVMLVAVGIVMAFQVHRMRALGNYYEHRHAP